MLNYILNKIENIEYIYIIYNNIINMLLIWEGGLETIKLRWIRYFFKVKFICFL